jgi:peptide/nickel transport system permease protein
MAKSRFTRPRGVTPVVCVTLLSLLVFLALFGGAIWGEAAKQIHPAHPLEPASRTYWFGTDELGRDIFARVMAASRLSLELALMAAAIGVVAGVGIGIGQAVLGRSMRRLLSGAITVSLAFPGLLLALLVNAIIGAGPTGAVVGVGVALIPPFARFAQTLASSAAGSEYVAAARVLGIGRARIMLRHILPNIAKPLALTALMAIGTALVSISALSFLGLGIQPPKYDWGTLLQSGLQVIYVLPMAAIGPTIVIVLAGLAFNLAGEAFATDSYRLLIPSLTGSGLTERVRDKTALAEEPATPSTEHQDDLALAATEAVVLRVQQLRVAYPGTSGDIVPVRDVSLEIRPGERVGLVGESGCGKSTLALALACLLTSPVAVAWEHFEFDTEVIQPGEEARHRRLFGTEFAVVFQDPANSLNPAIRVGRQLAELREVHYGDSRKASFATATERLRDVQIPNPEVRARQYPHEFSGGMRQRAMIASGLMGTPRLLVADEPTTALDVTVQAHVIRLLERISDETGTAVLFISHDISVVVSFCSRVLVMYAGRIVENVPTEWLLTRAAHPYTRALISAVPDVDDTVDEPLATISGRPPNLDDLPAGCAFAARCPFADEQCRTSDPSLAILTAGHLVACWHPRPADESSSVAAGVRPHEASAS